MLKSNLKGCKKAIDKVFQLNIMSSKLIILKQLERAKKQSDVAKIYKLIQNLNITTIFDKTLFHCILN